jgi:hypothetical protein
LSLVLKSPDYDVQLIPASALSRPGSLEGVQNLRVALGRDTERRKILLASLKDESDTDLLVLELVAASEKRSGLWGELARSGGLRVTWPCSIDVLRRHIETALPRGPELTNTQQLR